MKFTELPLLDPVLQGIADAGFTECTPIQEKALPLALAGKDVAGQAQTGTGKTAAFLITLFTRLLKSKQETKEKNPRALILAPTRELVVQIEKDAQLLGKHCGFTIQAIYGGVDYMMQRDALKEGVDIVIGTPGRLIDYLKQKVYTLKSVEALVIDEADRMFDMGFINDIRKIVAALPAQRQTLLFSATMPDDIRKLADRILRDPVRVEVAAKSAAADTVEQAVYFVAKRNKPTLLKHVIEQAHTTRVLVFTRTKHGADKVARHLSKSGIRAEAIHGNKTQGARQRALANFKSQHRRGVARGQLRSAQRARDVRASHRPHRPRGRHRHCPVVLRSRRARAPARDREAAAEEDTRVRRPSGVPSRFAHFRRRQFTSRRQRAGWQSPRQAGRRPEPPQAPHRRPRRRPATLAAPQVWQGPRRGRRDGRRSPTGAAQQGWQVGKAACESALEKPELHHDVVDDGNPCRAALFW
jgi:hypothetical protein